MAKYKGYDFCGWATRNDIRCSDGRIIRRDAFAGQDGEKVPLVWGHNHDDPSMVLGHAYLENRPEGVFAYGYFNDGEAARSAKEDVDHGDVSSLSIWANHLKQRGGDVLHGVIKEVSLVLAGANIGAQIVSPVMAHSDGGDTLFDEAYIYVGDDYGLEFYHEDTDEGLDKDDFAEEVIDNDEGEEIMDEEKTVQDVIDSMDDDQLKVLSYLVAEAAAEAGGSDDDDDDAVEHNDFGGYPMNYNAFEGVPTMDNAAYISHADEENILAVAKKYGSLKEALSAYCDENSLSHDGLAAVSGFGSYPVSGEPAAVDALFPEWHDVRPGAPELVTNDQAWVKDVLNKVHRSPFSRIRTSQVDLREIETIRAKGYQKGNEKILAGQYNVAKRTTSPQTVYVRSALNRDDIVDITDFDYVDYQYKIDRMQLEKELARAVLIGDGRDSAAADKINPENIRPIWGDASLFTIYKTLNVSAASNGSNTSANFGPGYLYAQAAEEAILDAKVDYRGSGALEMFCEQSFYNKMLLAKDLNGRRLYNNKNELMSALEATNVYNVPEFQNKTRTVGEGASAKTYKLLAILVNLNDYALGSTKGGEITHFTDFDIDFNQNKSLIETRVSGANTRIYSAIVLEEEVS